MRGRSYWRGYQGGTGGVDDFYYYGPGVGERRAPQVIGFANNTLKPGDVAAPGSWYRENPNANALLGQGKYRYVTVAVAPPGPDAGGQYRVADWSMLSPGTHSNKWEFWLPKGTSSKQFMQSGFGAGPSREVPHGIGLSPQDQ